jgi:hypothetical protein
MAIAGNGGGCSVGIPHTNNTLSEPLGHDGDRLSRPCGLYANADIEVAGTLDVERKTGTERMEP